MTDNQQTTPSYLYKTDLGQTAFKDCRPCPWCENKLFTKENMQKDEAGNVALFCYYCGATGLYKDNAYQAWRAWNRRGLAKERKQHYSPQKRSGGVKVTVTYGR